MLNSVKINCKPVALALAVIELRLSEGNSKRGSQSFGRSVSRSVGRSVGQSVSQFKLIEKFSNLLKWVNDPKLVFA